MQEMFIQLPQLTWNQRFSFHLVTHQVMVVSRGTWHESGGYGSRLTHSEVRISMTYLKSLFHSSVVPLSGTGV